MLILLKLLTITVLILLSLFALALLLLLVFLLLPWSYEADGSVMGKEVRGFLEGGSFLRLVYFGVRTGIGAEDRIFVRFLGFKILEITERDRDTDEEGNERSETVPSEETFKMSSSGFFESQPEDRKSPAGSAGTAAEHPEDHKEPENRPVSSAEKRSGEETDGKEKTETRKERRVRYKYLLSRKAREVSLKFKNFILALKESFGKQKELKEFLQSEKNRKLLKLVFKELKKDLVLILPREGNGEIQFGVGDPYYTGKILEFLGLLYPLYGKVIRICPLFEETRFEARAEVKGKFYLIVLLVSFCKLYWNQNLQQMYREFMRNFKHERTERSKDGCENDG